MIKNNAQVGEPAVLYKDTTANIEALPNPVKGMHAYSIDDDKYGTYNGASWDWGGGALADHDHSGDAGDGGQFAIENLTTAETTTTKRLAPDGSGGVEFVAGGGGVTRSGSTTDEHLAVWNGSDADSIKDGGVVPAGGGGALVLLEQHTASNSGSLDFTAIVTGTYDEYVIEVVGIVPVTSLADLMMRFSADGGSNWDATAAHYAWNCTIWSAGGSGVGGSQSTTEIRLAYGGTNTGVAASGNFFGSYKLTNINSGTIYPRFFGQYSYIYDAGNPSEGGVGFGAYLQTTGFNAIRFLMSSGNISSGTIRLYGVARS